MMFGSWLKELRRKRAIYRLDARSRARGDRRFSQLVETAADSFGAPVALLSLIRGNELWVGAATGVDVVSIPRGHSFCNHVLDRPDLLEVCDPLTDERFRELPVVRDDPGIKYYIGAPLRLNDGTDIGALCVLDVRFRNPASADQRAYLKALARQVTQALELRQNDLETTEAA